MQGAIEDGEVINPHGMDPQTVLRFVKSIGAWPGQVIVIACEPAEVEEMGWGLSDQVSEAVERAVELVVETMAELGGQPLAELRGRPGAARGVHELSLSSAVVNTAAKHAGGRRVSVVSLRVGRLRQVVPDTLEFYFEFVARDTVCEGARLEQEVIDGAPALPAVRARVGDRDPRLSLPDVRRQRGRDRQRQRVRSRVDRSRGGRMHRTKVTVVEEALDANNTIATANRADFDRAEVKVINFMSAPGAGKTTLLERVVTTSPGSGWACSKATCRARWTPTGWPACTCRSPS